MSSKAWTLTIEAMPVSVAAVALTTNHEQYSISPNFEGNSC